MRNKEAGMTLLEVVIAVAVLAVAVCGTVGAMLACYQMNTRSREENLATAAAQDMLATIRETPFENIVASFSGTTFRVNGLNTPAGGADHGEVIIIADETPDEAVYSRDLELPAGPDGLDLNGDGDRTDVLNAPDPTSTFPYDLDGDGALVTGAVAPANFKLIPVVVLVRWESSTGMARLQFMTMIVDRDG